MSDISKDYLCLNVDEKFRNIVSQCERPWDKAEVLTKYVRSLGFNDIILVPRIYGRRNKIKYDSWFAISSITKIIGGRADDLKIKLLKDFDFLTIDKLEKQMYPPQKVGGIEDDKYSGCKTRPVEIASNDDSKQIIIPSHLCDSRKNQRFYVSYTAVMTYIRHVASKQVPVLVKGHTRQDISRFRCKETGGYYFLSL